MVCCRLVSSGSARRAGNEGASLETAPYDDDDAPTIQRQPQSADGAPRVGVRPFPSLELDGVELPPVSARPRVDLDIEDLPLVPFSVEAPLPDFIPHVDLDIADLPPVSGRPRVDLHVFDLPPVPEAEPASTPLRAELDVGDLPLVDASFEAGPPRLDLDLGGIGDDLGPPPSSLPAAVPSSRGLKRRSSALDQTYLDALGGPFGVPRVVVSPAALTGLSLAREAAFLLSLIDGASTVDDLIDISGMGRLDTLRTLYELLQRRVVSVED